MTSLKTQNLIYGYSKAFSIYTEDIHIKKGQRWCIMGENGCGKTTLLKTLSSSLKPLKGEVLLGDKNIHQMNATDVSKEVAFVDFKISPPPYLSVIEFLQYSFYHSTSWLAFLSKEQTESILNTAQQLNIQHLMVKELRTLSDGQRQKVIVASALVKSPSFIIMDEPTNHLDIKQRQQLAELLKNIEPALVFTSHDVDFTLQLAQDYLLIKNNKTTLKKDMNRNDINAFFY